MESVTGRLKREAVPCMILSTALEANVCRPMLDNHALSLARGQRHYTAQQSIGNNVQDKRGKMVSINRGKATAPPICSMMSCHKSGPSLLFLGIRGSSIDVEQETGYHTFRAHSSANCPFVHPAYRQNQKTDSGRTSPLLTLSQRPSAPPKYKLGRTCTQRIHDIAQRTHT